MRNISGAHPPPDAEAVNPYASGGQATMLHPESDADPRRREGILIVYEGISGSGKSERIRRLKRTLEGLGVSAVIVEWNDVPFLRAAVRVLDACRCMTPGIYSLLQWSGFLFSRRRRVGPALRRGAVVIADRYTYTGLARDAVNGAPAWIGRPWSASAPAPDLLFFCDTAPEVCRHRITSRGKALYHPSRSFRRDSGPEKDLRYLERMRACYLELFAEAANGGGAAGTECCRILTADASDEAADIHAVLSLLAARGAGGASGAREAASASEP
ncbi:dTMP kinase [Gorillibacterium sp. sgz500922]|uniref:dTMP kinase n=1 Tax=Gorillibacterium sp. sgz500922 TaxID=3446694 RepID=UPI003F660F2D